MALWDLIRDFYVVNFFGGTDSQMNQYSRFFGTIVNNSGDYDSATTNLASVNIGQIFSDNENTGVFSYISLGDWLSTTFTIITLVLLIIFLYIFVKWIFKLFAGLLYR